MKGDIEEEVRRCYFRLSFTTWKCVNSVCFKRTWENVYQQIMKPNRLFMTIDNLENTFPGRVLKYRYEGHPCDYI